MTQQDLRMSIESFRTFLVDSLHVEVNEPSLLNRRITLYTSSNNKTLNARLLAITRNGAAAEIFCARLQSFWRLHLSILNNKT